MAKVKEGALPEYFKTARTYDQDRVLSAERSKKLAWSVAGLSMAGAMVAVLAVAALTPLKTVVPYVIRVDNSTGITEVLSGLSETRQGYSEIVTRSHAARYVVMREGWVATEMRINYNGVSVMSDQAEQGRFRTWYGAGNADGPQVVYGPRAIARVTIKSISLLEKDVIQVRYLRTVTRGDDVRTSHWVSTLTYSYVTGKMTEAERLLNPLGFVVSVYRSDPEGQQG